MNNLTCIQLFVQVTSTHASTAWQPTIVSFVHRSCTVASHVIRGSYNRYLHTIPRDVYNAPTTLPTVSTVLSPAVYYHQLLKALLLDLLPSQRKRSRMMMMMSSNPITLVSTVDNVVHSKLNLRCSCYPSS